MHPRHFENGKSYFVAVPVERSRKTFSNNSCHPRRLNRLRGDGASGGATEVASRYDDVALLHSLRKFGIERFQYMFRHLGKTLPHDMCRRDFVCWNVVTEFPAVP